MGLLAHGVCRAEQCPRSSSDSHKHIMGHVHPYSCPHAPMHAPMHGKHHLVYVIIHVMVIGVEARRQRWGVGCLPLLVLRIKCSSSWLPNECFCSLSHFPGLFLFSEPQAHSEAGSDSECWGYRCCFLTLLSNHLSLCVLWADLSGGALLLILGVHLLTLLVLWGDDSVP